jgi:hypothetical protein
MAAVYYQTSNVGVVQILPADTTSYKTLLTAGANGTVVTNISVHSTDTAAKDVILAVTVSGTDYPKGTVSIPLRTGDTSSAPSVNLLTMTNIASCFNTDVNGNRYLELPANATLRVKVGSTVTTAKAISFIAEGKNL